MAFEHRTYNSQLFRPKPEVEFDQSADILLVATPWGARAGAQKVVQTLKEHYISARDDKENTSPFERLSCLSSSANNLRTATLLANQMLYREENKNEYQVGVELFAAALFDQELVWLQLGAPSAFLQRKGRSLIPLSTAMDLTFDLSQDEEFLPPLPRQLLGLDSSIYPTMGSFRPRPGDQIILLARSAMSNKLLSFTGDHHELNELSRTLVEDNSQLPYWLGLWNIF